MKLYTYYATCPTHDVDAELRLLTLWREHWTAQGFEPFVLSEWHARQHPYFEEYEREIRKLPSVNSEQYEQACWFRWLALAQVGGGFMADFDVFARGRLPANVVWPLTVAQGNRLQVFQTRNICPSFVYASSPVALELCRRFATRQHGQRAVEGREHWSDMLAIEDMVKQQTLCSGSEFIELHDVVRDYQGSENWEVAPLIHFSNGSTAPKGLTPRWKHIPELLKGMK